MTIREVIIAWPDIEVSLGAHEDASLYPDFLTFKIRTRGRLYETSPRLIDLLHEVKEALYSICAGKTTTLSLADLEYSLFAEYIPKSSEWQLTIADVASNLSQSKVSDWQLILILTRISGAAERITRASGLNFFDLEI